MRSWDLRRFKEYGFQNSIQKTSNKSYKLMRILNLCIFVRTVLFLDQATSWDHWWTTCHISQADEFICVFRNSFDHLMYEVKNKSTKKSTIVMFLWTIAYNIGFYCRVRNGRLVLWYPGVEDGACEFSYCHVFDLCSWKRCLFVCLC